MLREVVGRNCVGGIWCASARAGGIDFQACSFNHSDISPFDSLRRSAQAPLESTSAERPTMIIAETGQIRRNVSHFTDTREKA